MSLVASSLEKAVCSYTHPKELSEIAEALDSELVVTAGSDHPPIAASCCTDNSFIIGGYESTNRIAFVMNCISVKQLNQYGSIAQSQIKTLAKKKINHPIQLHLRGKITIEDLSKWMSERAFIKMVVTSIADDKGLAIDARTGEFKKYDPRTNPHARKKDKDEEKKDEDRGLEPAIETVHLANEKTIPQDGNWLYNFAASLFA